MKRAILIGLVFISCAKPSPVVEKYIGLSSSRQEVIRIFETTRSHSSKNLFEAGALALKAKIPLGPPQAETCLREEEARPDVKDLCLLLWSQGGESTPFLEKVINGPDISSRPQAIARILRRSPFQEMSLDTLFKLLDHLKSDPAWIRSNAIEIWLEHHQIVDRNLQEAISQWIINPFPQDPLSLSSALRVLHKVHHNRWQKNLLEYCSPDSRGISRTRCWRLIGVLAKPQTDPKMKAEIIPFFPTTWADPDWIVFKRSFPHLAARVQKYLF